MGMRFACLKDDERTATTKEEAIASYLYINQETLDVNKILLWLREYNSIMKREIEKRVHKKALVKKKKIKGFGARRVRCVETGKVFPTVGAAIDMYGWGVSKVIDTDKTTKGYHFVHIGGK